MADLKSLMTETRNKNTMNLDEMTPYEIVSVMNGEDEKVVKAVYHVLPEISRTIELAIESLTRKGRIIYIGAGTSYFCGRLQYGGWCYRWRRSGFCEGKRRG